MIPTLLINDLIWSTNFITAYGLVINTKIFDNNTSAWRRDGSGTPPARLTTSLLVGVPGDEGSPGTKKLPSTGSPEEVPIARIIFRTPCGIPKQFEETTTDAKKYLLLNASTDP
jgi:hypothetical protein